MRLGFCFQICLYSGEFGTNYFGHVKGMSDLSTFQFCNWFDNLFGPFVNCLPLLRPITDGCFMQSGTGQFLIAKNIHPELLVCYLTVAIAASGSPGFSPRSWMTISQEL